MDIDVRTITEDEIPAFFHCNGTAFGEPPDEEETGRFTAVLELDRSLAAVEDGKFVGAAGAFTFEMNVAGGVDVPAAGVSWVGVLPTHRRRGVLSALMTRQLDDVAERGEPAAILTASEAPIYGRFGYGAASFYKAFSVSTRYATFAPEAPLGGRLRLLTSAEAAEQIPGLFDRLRRRHPGQVTRNATYWSEFAKDYKTTRGGASERFILVHSDDEGNDDGLVVYRMRPDWDGNLPASTCEVFTFMADDDRAAATLWRFLLDLDLTTTVKGTNFPLDDPLPYLLQDLRQVQVSRMGEHLWVRPLDVPALLAARRYVAADRLVLAVSDRFRPAVEGRYELDTTDPDAPGCERIGDLEGPADLTMDVAGLGAAYLGHPGTVTGLARAGRAAPLTDDAVGRAERVLAWHTPPWCVTGF